MKISQLPVAGTLTGTELVPVVQGSNTVQTTASQVGALSPYGNDKILNLPTGTQPTGAEYLPASQSGNPVRLSINQMLSGVATFNTKINVSKAFGLNPNPTTDQTAAIVAAIAAVTALGTGYEAFFPGGVYCYTGPLLFTCGISGEGVASELRCISADGSNSLIHFASVSNFRIADLKFNAINCTGFLPTEDDGLVKLTSCDNYEVTRCYFTNAGSGALLQRSCTNGRVTWNTLVNIYHDGIHHTKACANILTSQNQIINGGDDAIAIVGYKGDRAYPQQIIVTQNRIYGTKYARGIAVVGASSIIISDNYIQKTYGAGVIVTSEHITNPITGALIYENYGSSNIDVHDNIIDGCGNTLRPGLHNVVGAYGAVHVVGASGGFNNIKIHHNTILNSAASAFYVGGAGYALINSEFCDNTVNDTTDLYNKNGVTLTTSATAASGTTLTFASTYWIGIGMTVSATNVPAGTTVVAVNMTTVTLSNAITGSIASGSSIIFYDSGWAPQELYTSAATATGAVLTFPSTAGLTIGMGANGSGLPAASLPSTATCFVVGLTLTTVTLSFPVSSAVASGTLITFTPPGTQSWAMTINAPSALGTNVLYVADTTNVFIGMRMFHGFLFEGATVTATTPTSITVAGSLANNLTAGAAVYANGVPYAYYPGIQVYQANTLRVSRNTVINAGDDGIYITNSVSGNVECCDNIGVNINQACRPARSFIEVQSGLATGVRLVLDNNYMRLPDKYPQPIGNLILNPNWGSTSWGTRNRCQNDVVGISGGIVSATITPTGSPFIIAHTGPTFTPSVLASAFSGADYSITGGTVSDISISHDGVNYYSTRVTSGLFHLSFPDFMRITYTVAPTIVKVPRLSQ